jgi:hypothetical protein
MGETTAEDAGREAVRAYQMIWTQARLGSPEFILC